MMNFLQKNRYYIFAILYFGLALPLAFILNIWEDEVFTLNTTSNGLKHAFNQAIYFELQPPIYFVLMAVWRFISESIIWARLFSIIAIFFTIILLDNLTKKKSKYNLLIIIWFILHPVTIEQATNIRVYPFIVLFVAFYYYFLLNYYNQNSNSLKYRLLNILFIIIGIFSYYYFGFYIAALFCILIIYNRNIIKNYFIDLIIPFLLSLMSLRFIFSHIEGHSTYLDLPVISIYEIIHFSVVQFQDIFILPLYFIGLPGWFNLTLRLVFLISIILFIIKNKNNLQDISIYKNLFLSLIIIFFMNIIRFLLGDIYVIHPHAIIAFIPISLFLFTFFLKDNRSKTGKFIIIILIFINISALYSKYKEPYKYYDIKSLSAWINEQPIDMPIFIYTNEVKELLDYYVDENKNLIPLPKEIKYDKYNYIDWVINDMNALDIQMKGYLESFKADEFIFITNNKDYVFGVPLNQEEIRNYFLEEYSLSDSLQVNTYSIFFLKSKKPF